MFEQRVNSDVLTVSTVNSQDQVTQKPLRDSVKQALKNYFAQLNGQDVSDLYELVLAEVASGKMPQFHELSRFPEVRRDLALIAHKDVAASAVLDVIRENAGEWLTDLRLFDVYQGKGIDPDRKSLAVGLTWQHPSRTLNDDEVNTTTQNILTSLEQRLNATLRK